MQEGILMEGLLKEDSEGPPTVGAGALKKALATTKSPGVPDKRFALHNQSLSGRCEVPGRAPWGIQERCRAAASNAAGGLYAAACRGHVWLDPGGHPFVWLVHYTLAVALLAASLLLAVNEAAL
jgi:hypothetical protein